MYRRGVFYGEKIKNYTSLEKYTVHVYSAFVQMTFSMWSYLFGIRSGENLLQQIFALNITSVSSSLCVLV